MSRSSVLPFAASLSRRASTTASPRGHKAAASSAHHHYTSAPSLQCKQRGGKRLAVDPGLSMRAGAQHLQLMLFMCQMLALQQIMPRMAKASSNV